MPSPTPACLARRLFTSSADARRPAALPRLGEFAGRPLEDRVVPTFGTTGLLSPVAAGAEPVAAVEAGPRLLAAATADSALLNGLLTTLAGPGSSVALTAVDYESLSNGSVNLGGLLGRLQATLGVGSPAAALTADATLGQLLTAAAGAAQADGDTALASVFGASAGAVGSADTVRLGDLLNVSLPAGSFAQAEVNALDLLVGGVQLLNYQNTATTADPVVLTAPALGPLGAAVQSVTLQARVVEPPVFVVGPAGSQFHSAAVRLKLDVDLTDVSLDTAALTAPVRAVLGNAATVTATAAVGRLSLYADVARSSGTIQAIDALTNAVTLRSTPAVADVYLGTVADGVFFDRTHPIDPATDLSPGLVGSLSVSATLPVVGPVLNLNLGLTARSAAEGAALTPYVTNFLPAFPKAATVGSSAAVVADLVSTLVANLRVGVSGDLGVLAPQATPINAALSGAATSQLRPTLHALLGGLLDPALGSLGIGLGQLDLIVLGADSPDAPVAADDAAGTTVGRPVTVPVLANDTVQAGTTPAVSLAAAPQHGTAVVNADGSITYTPAAGYRGADSFGYTLTDAYGRTSSATVRVQVSRGANTPPAASPDTATTTAGTAVTVNVLANDTDADGDPLTVQAVSSPAHGTATVNPDGSITYTPAAGFRGADTFTYTAADGFGGTATGAVSVQVGRGPNQTPVAVPDSSAATVGTPVTINVLANDTDGDGDPLAVTAVTAPAHGSAVVNADGTITYTPARGFRGADTFTYTVSDGFGGVATGVVTVTVGGDNPPVASPDSVTAVAGTAVTFDVLTNDTDPDGDPLTAAVSVPPAHGSVVENADGTLTYTPAAGYLGADTFTYMAADRFGGSATGVVSIQVVRGPNRSPVAVPDAVAATAGTAITFDVRANDTDADGDSLAVVAITQPAHGGVLVNADGTLTYTPASGYVGGDSFTYTVADGFGGTATASVSVTVGRGPNRNPVARPDAPFTPTGTAVTVAVLANDTDADGDSLTVAAVTQPAHGTAVINADGTVTYTPAAGFRGVDTFTYTAADGFGGTGSATVTVVVGTAAGNSPPVARPDTLVTTAGVAATIDVRANDSDADGDPLAVQLATPPAHGTVTVNADGTLTYTPQPGYVGADAFAYLVSDGFGGSATGAVTVTVGRGPNHSPTPSPDAATTTPGAPVTVDVRANDLDPDGDPLTVSAVSTPGSGDAVINPDGTITYTPRRGFRGSDTFSYTVTDGAGGSATGAVTVTVAGNTPPVARPDVADATAGTAVTLAVLANDTDADGDPLTLVGVAAPAHGTATANADGTLTYTPAAGFVGVDVFAYTATDGFGAPVTGTVTVTVRPAANTPPAVNADSLLTPVGTAVVIDVLANDTDADGDRLTVLGFTQPVHGTVAANANGTLTFTPAAGFRGVDSFSYTAGDGRGGNGTAVVTVVVGSASGNAVPVARADAASTVAGTAVTVNVLANDTDADGDPLSVVSVTAPAHGTTVLNADGSVTYTPAVGYVGGDSFTYAVADGFGGTATGAVSVAVGQPAPVPPTVPPTTPPTVPPAVPPVVPPTVPPVSPPTVPPVSPPSVPPPAPPTVPPTVPPVSPPPASPPAGTPPGGDTVRRPFAVGADTTGGPRVTVYNSDGSQRFNFFAYDPEGRFGVQAVLADVTGDGVADILTGPQLGGGPHVRVFDGRTLQPVYNFFAFEPDFRGGVSVAAADVDGDGRADLIVGAGVGGGPRVRVFSGRDGSVLHDFFAFDADRRDGVQVTAAVDAGGKAELVAATGGGPGPAAVRVFDLATERVVTDMPPFEPGYTGRVSVAVGDVTGDGTPDVVYGAGPGGGPRLRVIDGKSRQVIEDRFVYEESFTGGVRVAAADLDGDGRAEVLTGAGVGGGPRQQVMRGVGAAPAVDRFVFEEQFRGGILLG